MRTTRPMPAAALAAAIAALPTVALAQDFHTPGFIDDFESFTQGPPAGQNSWFSIGNVDFVSTPGIIGPEFGLQCLAVGVSSSSDRAVKVLSDDPAFGRIDFDIYFPDNAGGTVELIEGDSNNLVAFLEFTGVPTANPIDIRIRGSFGTFETGTEWIDNEINRIGIEVLPGDIVNYYLNGKLFWTGEDLSAFEGNTPVGFDEFEFTNERFVSGTFYLDNFEFPPTGPAPCSAADLAEPFGKLNFNDVVEFLTAFAAMDPAADLGDPPGVFNFNDVIAYLSLFAAGCP